MRLSCFVFFFDCLGLLFQKMFVSFVSTCFTVMLSCFIWFRRFMFFWALSRVVYVASDRSKVFLLSVVLGRSEVV